MIHCRFLWKHTVCYQPALICAGFVSPILDIKGPSTSLYSGVLVFTGRPKGTDSNQQIVMLESPECSSWLGTCAHANICIVSSTNNERLLLFFSMKEVILLSRPVCQHRLDGGRTICQRGCVFVSRMPPHEMEIHCWAPQFLSGMQASHKRLMNNFWEMWVCGYLFTAHWCLRLASISLFLNTSTGPVAVLKIESVLERSRCTLMALCGIFAQLVR